MLKEVLSGKIKKIPDGNKDLYSQRMKITGNRNYIGNICHFSYCLNLLKRYLTVTKNNSILLGLKHVKVKCIPT